MHELRTSEMGDLESIVNLYRLVAQTPGGLARLASEIDREYVQQFLSDATENGVGLVAVADDGRVLGEIHARSPGIACFAHVLTDLTIAVHPDAQSKGAGRQLFEAFMEEVTRRQPGITRIELVARESNNRALRFYRSLGFVQEGVFEKRIANSDGSLESDIPMAWLRTNAGRAR